MSSSSSGAASQSSAQPLARRREVTKEIVVAFGSVSMATLREILKSLRLPPVGSKSSMVQNLEDQIMRNGIHYLLSKFNKPTLKLIASLLDCEPKQRPIQEIINRHGLPAFLQQKCDVKLLQECCRMLGLEYKRRVDPVEGEPSTDMVMLNSEDLERAIADEVMLLGADITFRSMSTHALVEVSRDLGCLEPHLLAMLPAITPPPPPKVVHPPPAPVLASATAPLAPLEAPIQAPIAVSIQPVEGATLDTPAAAPAPAPLAAALPPPPPQIIYPPDFNPATLAERVVDRIFDLVPLQQFLEETGQVPNLDLQPPPAKRAKLASSQGEDINSGSNSQNGTVPANGQDELAGDAAGGSAAWITAQTAVRQQHNRTRESAERDNAFVISEDSNNSTPHKQMEDKMDVDDDSTLNNTNNNNNPSTPAMKQELPITSPQPSPLAPIISPTGKVPPSIDNIKYGISTSKLQQAYPLPELLKYCQLHHLDVAGLKKPQVVKKIQTYLQANAIAAQQALDAEMAAAAAAQPAPDSTAPVPAPMASMTAVPVEPKVEAPKPSSASKGKRKK